MKILALSVAVLFFMASLFGCAGIDKAIREHQKVAHEVNLGDSQLKTLRILLPTQRSLRQNQIKPPERYLEGKDTIEIFYMRSQRQPDGLTTDDEFTPYLFKNRILTGIGWQQLGGAKSQGQVVPSN